MKISDVTIENVTILNAKSGIHINKARDIVLRNVMVETAKGNVISLSGATDIVIDGLRTTATAASATIAADCADVVITKSQLDKEHVRIADGADNRIVKFK